MKEPKATMTQAKTGSEATIEEYFDRAVTDYIEHSQRSAIEVGYGRQDDFYADWAADAFRKGARAAKRVYELRGKIDAYKDAIAYLDEGSREEHNVLKQLKSAEASLAALLGEKL